MVKLTYIVKVTHEGNDIPQAMSEISQAFAAVLPNDVKTITFENPGQLEGLPYDPKWAMYMPHGVIVGNDGKIKRVLTQDESAKLIPSYPY